MKAAHEAAVAVERFASRNRRFIRPDVGELVVEHQRLEPSDRPDPQVAVYLADGDPPTREKMLTLVHHAG